MGDDVVGVDEVLFRLRHLFDGADGGKASGRDLDGLPVGAFALEANVVR